MKIKSSFGGSPKFKRNKYGNRKIHVAGLTFDSIKEMNYYRTLEIYKRAGEILDFTFKPEPIELIPVQPQHGLRAVTYRPDFLVFHKNGDKEYQDVKGYTHGHGIGMDVFKIKQKILAWRYGILVKIV